MASVPLLQTVDPTRRTSDTGKWVTYRRDEETEEVTGEDNIAGVNQAYPWIQDNFLYFRSVPYSSQE